MSDHTPGPWEGRMHNGTNLRGPNDEPICLVHTDNMANARLIAASPDLLAALEEVLAEIGDSYLSCKGSALEVIAKAKGGAE